MAVSGTSRYLAAQRCFTDGEHVLVWPRGSRPITGDRAGVEPGTDVTVLDGDSFTATGEVVLLEGSEGFPAVDPACAPSGSALSLSAVARA